MISTDRVIACDAYSGERRSTESERFVVAELNVIRNDTLDLIHFEWNRFAFRLSLDWFEIECYRWPAESTLANRAACWWIKFRRTAIFSRMWIQPEHTKWTNGLHTCWIGVLCRPWNIVDAVIAPEKETDEKKSKEKSLLLFAPLPGSELEGIHSMDSTGYHKCLWTNFVHLRLLSLSFKLKVSFTRRFQVGSITTQQSLATGHKLLSKPVD